MNEIGPDVRWDVKTGALAIRRPAPGVVLVVLSGTDEGQFGEAPFHELACDLDEHRTIELFFDARAGTGPSTEVSMQWAKWLGSRRNRFSAVRLLTGSQFITVSADFMRKYAGLGDRMCVYTHHHAFDEELAAACSQP